MNNTVDVLTKMLPVILMISLGYCMKEKHFFKSDTVRDLKKLIINIALPIILFSTFAKTKFDSKYIAIILIIIAVEFLLLFCGVLIRKAFHSENRFFQTLFTGFENGLMGYSMFIAVFGSSNLFKIAVVDIGNSLFLNAFLILYIRKLEKATLDYREQALSVVKTPTVVAIVMGLVVSITGCMPAILQNPWLSAGFSTLTLIGNITTPLICIVVGYELVIRLKSIRLPIVLTVIRLCLNLLVAFLLNTLIFVPLLHLDALFQIAVYTTFLLPPSFALSIFVKEGTEQENELLVNTISVHVIFSILAFMALLFFFHPGMI